MAQTSVFIRKYGKTLKELSKEYGVSEGALWKRDQHGALLGSPREDLFRRDRVLARILASKLRRIQQRCTNPRVHKYIYYGGRGIKCFLTLDDLEYLWNKSKARRMKFPSIDRVDPNGNYTRQNCQFIEMSDARSINRRLGKLKRDGLWSLKHSHCRGCLTIDVPHEGKG